MCLFISSNIIRGFLSSCYRFSTRRFPRRVISHPYCYVHYDVLDTTCVIGCLMNDILILFLCLLSRMLFGVFLISFSLGPEDFPASFLSSKPVNRETLKRLHFFFVYYPEYHSGLIIFPSLSSTPSAKQQLRNSPITYFSVGTTCRPLNCRASPVL